MAGFLTHYLFGIETCDKLSDNYVRHIIKNNNHAFLIGLHGTSLLSFNPHALNKRGLSYRTASMSLRNQEYAAFFNNMLDYINELPEENRDVCIAYMSGFLCYYAISQSSAPYILFRVWQDLPAKCHSSKLIAHRQAVETIIDSVLLRTRYHMEPSQLNFEALSFIGKQDLSTISKMMQHTIQATYKYNISKSEIGNGLRAIRRRNVYLPPNARFRHSLRQSLEKVLPIQSGQAKFYEDFITDDYDYMNTEQNPWYAYPGCPQASNLSFEEIFNQALLNSHSLLEGLDSCLSWGMNRDELIDNIIRMEPY